MNHSGEGAQQQAEHVSVVSYHHLSARDDYDDTLGVGHMQGLTLTLPTSNMIVCHCGWWKIRYTARSEVMSGSRSPPPREKSEM